MRTFFYKYLTFSFRLDTVILMSYRYDIRPVFDDPHTVVAWEVIDISGRPYPTGDRFPTKDQALRCAKRMGRRR